MTTEKSIVRQTIYDTLTAMKARNAEVSARLSDRVLLTDYAHLSRKTDTGTVWTQALQTALSEHEIVVIPPSDAIYSIDGSVIIPSHRRIEADGARIFLTPDCEVLMLRNAHTADGTHSPVPDGALWDCDITISGGIWGESRTRRQGYGATGRYEPRIPGADDELRAFYGVSTLFLFLCVDGLTLENLTFVHTAGFSVQTGYLKNGVFERIRFEGCFADGLHLNGASENLYISDISGEVGDDLVAFNMYDWQNSSVSFGATRCVWCEGLDLSPASPYKALRIEPGMYFYDDDSAVDCGLFDAVIRSVRGIATFKMYFQTPRYKLGEELPERGEVGSADNLFFEDIVIDLDRPIDGFPEYFTADPVRGAFAAFELGANIGYVSFSDIAITMYPEKFPSSYLVTVGPKSVVWQGCEIFDPYLSSRTGTVELHNIVVNGVKCENPAALVHATVFEDVNHDGMSTGRGEIGEILES